MGLNSSIPVRFSQDQDARLREVSEKSGIPVANLIRIAVDNYLAEIEKAGNVTVPMRDRGNYVLSKVNRPTQMNDKGGKSNLKLPSAEAEAAGSAVERVLKRRKS